MRSVADLVRPLASKKGVKALGALLILVSIIAASLPSFVLADEISHALAGRSSVAAQLDREIGGNQWDFVQNDVYKRVLVEVHSLPGYNISPVLPALNSLNDTLRTLLAKQVAGVTFSTDIPTSYLRDTYYEGLLQSILGAVHRTYKHDDVAVLTLLVLNGKLSLGPITAENLDATSIVLFPDATENMMVGELLLHELGHVMGLVAVHGLDSPYTPPNAASHLDPSSGTHCADPFCYMHASVQLSEHWCDQCKEDLAEIREQKCPYAPPVRANVGTAGSMLVAMVPGVSGMALGAMMVRRQDARSEHGERTLMNLVDFLRSVGGRFRLIMALLLVAALVLSALAVVEAANANGSYRLSLQGNIAWPSGAYHASSGVEIGGDYYVSLLYVDGTHLVKFDPATMSVDNTSGFYLSGFNSYNNPVVRRDNELFSFETGNVEQETALYLTITDLEWNTTRTDYVYLPGGFGPYCVLSNGLDVYLVGGTNVNYSSGNYQVNYSTAVYRLDLPSEQVVPITNLPFEWVLPGATFFMCGDYLVGLASNFGSLDHPGSWTNLTMQYDLSSGAWSWRTITEFDALIDASPMMVDGREFFVNWPSQEWDQTHTNLVTNSNQSLYWYDPATMKFDVVQDKLFDFPVLPIATTSGGILASNYGYGEGQALYVLHLDGERGGFDWLLPLSVGLLCAAFAFNIFVVRRFRA
ncbi:MAG TPA: hypothetical protein VMB46_02215 [Methanomassiliicoccales archaeon]|nr:hypothetical protein [Methanomassiliicoccales archaeon]